MQVRDLLATVTSLHELLKQLLELAGRKLAAMRSADAGALQQCAADEGGVLQALFEREKQRDAVLARLAQSLHWRADCRPRLSEIAERLPEPFSSRLRAKIVGLRQTAGELRHKNQLAAAVARNLHAHIRAVFEDVAKVNQESVVYGPSGKHEQRNKKTWVDAVG
ncbi:MAG: flagellar export chaperone FlgN [Phycisphaerae bacterium]